MAVLIPVIWMEIRAGFDFSFPLHLEKFRVLRGHALRCCLSVLQQAGQTRAGKAGTGTDSTKNKEELLDFLKFPPWSPTSSMSEKSDLTSLTSSSTRKAQNKLQEEERQCGEGEIWG